MPTCADPPMTPQELLLSVDRWLCRLAERFARPRAEREEFLADLRLDVLEHAHQFDPARGKPTTWATWRAWHVSTTRRRRRERQAREMPQGCHEVGFLDFRPGREPDPADAAERREDVARAREQAGELLSILPERDQLIVRLRLGRGLSLSAIGRRFGITHERVRQVCGRAVSQLRAAAG